MSPKPRPNSAERPPDREVQLSGQYGEEIEEHLRGTRLAALFLQSPSFMAVTRGSEHVFVNANPTYRQLSGGRELIGRTARDAFPELESQGHFELLDRVYETGEPYVGSEESVRLRRPENGQLETFHVCYSYHPLRDDAGDISGVLHHGVDATERVELRNGLRRRVRQQSAVAELGRRALASDSLTDIYEEAAETARTAIGANSSVLYRRVDDVRGLVREAMAGEESSSGLETALATEGDHLPGRAYREKRPILLRSGTDGGAGSNSLPETLALEMGVPVPGDDAPLGVMTVHSRDDDAFSEEDVPILEAVAQIVGAATVREEERRFRDTVARNLPGLLYRCRNDRDWTMELLSEGTEALTGYSPDQLTSEDGTRYADLIHPEDRERVWEEVQKAVREDRPFHVDYRIVTRGGEERWVWEQGRAVEPRTGGSSMLEGYIFDITEKKAMENEAGWFDSVLQAAFRGTDEALFVVGLPERKIVECNRAAEELFDYDREELLGRETELLHVDRQHQEEFERRSAQALRERGYFRGEFEMERRDGTVFPTDHSVTYVDGDTDPPAYAVSIVRDISDRKDRETRLERSQRLLERYAAHVTEAREEERAAIAREVHDELGQSLTVLKFELERIRKTAREDTVARESADRGLEVTEALLDQVRELSVSLRPASLNSVGLRRSLGRLVDRWEDTSGLSAEFRYEGPDDGLGGDDRDIHVYRIVQEALTNVARHAEARRAVVDVRKEAGQWRIRIEDDGTGIPDAEIREFAGHGLLGMEERARILDGDLRLRSEEGGGTEVELVVPSG